MIKSTAKLSAPKNLFNLPVTFDYVTKSFLLFLVFLGLSGNNKIILYVAITSLLLALILNSLILGLITPFLSVALLSQLIKISTISKYLENKNINFFIFSYLVSLLLVALLLRYFFKNIFTVKNDLNLLNTFWIFVFFGLMKNFNFLDSEKSIRFLSSTGEDNSAWIDALAKGYDSDTGKFNFVSPDGNDVRSTTHVLLFLARQIHNFGNQGSNLTENAAVLSRFSLSLIFFVTLVVALGISNYLISRSVNPTIVVSSSILSALCTYLGLSSFAMFGHLTPIISITILYLALFLSIFENSLVKFKTKQRVAFTLFIFVLLISATDAWWPLRPLLYFVIILFIVNFYERKLNKVFFSFSKVTQLVFLITFTVLLLLVITSNYFNIQLDNYLNNFGALLHLPGGTLTPGTIHLILVGISIAILIIEFTNRQEHFFVMYILTSLLFYYVIVVLLSLVTPPYTIDYAANKLGLFLIVIVMPFQIILVSLFLKNKLKSLIGGIAYLLAGTILILNSGSPTYSGNPSWNQFIFPKVLINKIESEDTYVWEGALVDAIESNPNKKILCFNRFTLPVEMRSDVLTAEYRCSKFAAALQGFKFEEFLSYWLQVNLNSSSPEEFASRIPADFNDNYVVLFIDELIDPQQNSIRNTVSETLDEILIDE